VNGLDPNENSSFVLLLSNIYADFEEATEWRLFLKDKQIDKELICSLIEANDVVHEFIAGGWGVEEDKMQG